MGLRPEDVGLPEGQRRRVAGLRRREVALLADVGITWYTWLEQGRSINVSPETVGRIAAALRLTAAETEYVRRLISGPTEESLDEPRVPSRIRRLLDVFEQPAFASNARLDVLACNRQYRECFRMAEWQAPHEKNFLWFLFTNPIAAEILVNPRAAHEPVVATFRMWGAAALSDPRASELIHDLSAASDEFKLLWEKGTVAWTYLSRFHTLYSLDGPRTYEVITFVLPDSANVHVGLMIAYDDDTLSRMTTARVPDRS